MKASRKLIKTETEISFVLILLMLLPCVSCRQEESELVRFSTDIVPVLENRCIQCHAPGRTPPFLAEDTYYKALRKSRYTRPSRADDSPLYTSLTDDHVTPALPANELALFKDWINQGALDN